MWVDYVSRLRFSTFCWDHCNRDDDYTVITDSLGVFRPRFEFRLKCSERMDKTGRFREVSEISTRANPDDTTHLHLNDPQGDRLGGVWEVFRNFRSFEDLETAGKELFENQNN